METKIVVGDTVKSIYDDPNGYYNDIGTLKAGTIGKVAHIVPKVRIVGERPIHDRKDTFLVCDTSTGERFGINWCNAQKV